MRPACNTLHGMLACVRACANNMRASVLAGAGKRTPAKDGSHFMEKWRLKTPLVVRNCAVNRARARVRLSRMPLAACLTVSMFVIDWCSGCVRCVRILGLDFLFGVLAHPKTRAAVLSAPCTPCRMPLSGPHPAAGVAPATPAPLADPGPSPMSAG